MEVWREFLMQVGNGGVVIDGWSYSIYVRMSSPTCIAEKHLS